MAFKDIVVHIDNSKACRERLNVAVQVAKSQDGVLTGLYILTHAEVPRFMEVHLGPELLEAQRRAAQDAAKEAKALFIDAVTAAGLRAEWQEIEVPLAGVSDAIAMYARHCDLTVLGQHNPDADDITSVGDLPDKVILTAGAPVLVVPHTGHFETIGERVMIAWKPYREAVRALKDSMPFLETAKAVRLLCANPNKAKRDYQAVPGADIKRLLERHDISAQAEYLDASGIGVGDLILSRAADESADLIVCGAYGRPRLRELMLGGVTRHLLGHMTVPVLMSH